MSTSETMSKVGMGASVPAAACRVGGLPVGLSSPAAGRCPSGQRKQAVNLSVNAYGGSNPPRPTQGRVPVTAPRPRSLARGHVVITMLFQIGCGNAGHAHPAVLLPASPARRAGLQDEKRD